MCPFDFFHSPHLFISVHSETPCSLCLLFNIFICYFCFGAFLQHTVSLSFSDSISLQFSPQFFHFFNFFFSPYSFSCPYKINRGKGSLTTIQSRKDCCNNSRGPFCFPVYDLQDDALNMFLRGNMETSGSGRRV